MPPTSRTRLGFGRWTLGCGFAEFAGIALAALWWVMMDRLNPEPAGAATMGLMLVAKGAAGLIEGAILGLVQAILLRRRYPRLSVRGWAFATILLAGAGWVLGSAPSIFLSGGAAAGADPPLGQVLGFAAAFGLAVGAAFGAAQWLVLRRAAIRAVLWIPANMLAWAAALPVIYLAASLGGGAAQIGEVALRALAGGLGAGLLLGAILYLFIRRMEAAA